jgi:predicted dehydrogenase
MSQNGPARIAVLGAGLIGRRHATYIRDAEEAELVCIVDPSDAARQFAGEIGTPWTASLGEMLRTMRPDGIIVATPNQLHTEHGLEATKAGIPILVEKPISDSLASGEALVSAAEAAGVPILVGHHRRHNAIIQQAKKIIDEGRLGRALAAHMMFWLFKPDDYFEVGWRRQKGAGPVFINLIHDVDLLRYLLGDVVSVQAAESGSAREGEVEDTCGMVMRLASGALATLTISDSVVAPWSWEHTSAENSAYPNMEQPCYFIGGTHGSLTLPSLELFTHPGERSWLKPFDVQRTASTPADPLVTQLRHFVRVIRNEEAPIISGREGLNTLKVVLAAKQAAQSGACVELASFG